MKHTQALCSVNISRMAAARGDAAPGERYFTANSDVSEGVEEKHSIFKDLYRVL